MMMPSPGQGPAFAFSSIKVVLGGEAGEWDYVTLELREGAHAACECECACARACACAPALNSTRSQATNRWALFFKFRTHVFVRVCMHTGTRRWCERVQV